MFYAKQCRIPEDFISISGLEYGAFWFSLSRGATGNPINVETNAIDTVTPEEYIRDTFQNISDSKKE